MTKESKIKADEFHEVMFNTALGKISRINNKQAKFLVVTDDTQLKKDLKINVVATLLKNPYQKLFKITRQTLLKSVCKIYNVFFYNTQ